MIRYIFHIALLVSLAACGRPVDVPARQADARGKSALSVSLQQNQAGHLIVRFTNRSNAKTISILKPLDRSEESWVMPHYRLSIVGSETQLGAHSRCGNFGSPYEDTTWPDDYLIEIAPGKTYEHVILFPSLYGPADKVYPVVFEYVFMPDSDLLRNGKQRYPDGLWRGRVKSNAIRTQLTVFRPVVG